VGLTNWQGWRYLATKKNNMLEKEKNVLGKDTQIMPFSPYIVLLSNDACINQLFCQHLSDDSCLWG